MSNTSFLYVATSQRPTGANRSVVGHFTAANELNLIVAKASRIEIHTISADGLQPVLDVPIYGRVATLGLIRLHGDKKDSIVITTERFQLMVLSYDAKARLLRPLANGDLRDRIGVPSDTGLLAAIDHRARCVAMHMNTGLLKVVNCERGFRAEARNLRLEETYVVDLAFLHCPEGDAPTLAVLARDLNDRMFVRSYELLLRDNSMRPGPLREDRLDADATLLVPVPLPIGGVLVLGARTITHCGGAGKEAESIRIDSSAAGSGGPRCFAPIDPLNFLLGDAAGGVHLISLVPEPSDRRLLKGISMRRIGKAAVASCLSFLGNGFAFVGSQAGDSQLIKLHAEGAASAPRLEVLQSYASLGPIVDFTVMDLDRQGQGQVVTASGKHAQGSLRIVRAGIGIEEQAVVELPGIRGLWALRDGGDDAAAPPSSSSSAPDARVPAGFDTYLLQSYATETRVFVMDGEEMAESEDALGAQGQGGFQLNVPTLHAGNTGAGGLLQVTETHVRVVVAGAGGAKRLAGVWSPSDSPATAGKRITVGTSLEDRVLLALSGGLLVLLQLAWTPAGAAAPSLTIRVESSRQMPHEVSCLSLEMVPQTEAGEEDSHPAAAAPEAAAMDEEEGAAAPPSSSAVSPARAAIPLASVGLWTDTSVRVLRLPSLEEAALQLIGGEVPPRSSLLVTLEGWRYLLAGMGDGRLVNFRLVGDAAKASSSSSSSASAAAQAGGLQLSQRRDVALGSQPISLRLMHNKGKRNVFAACDRPTVLFSSNRKLLYSNVNVPHVSVMTPFHSAAFPEALALATDSGLTIGTVDDIEKLQIRTVPLGEQPRRIVHHARSRTIVVAVEAGRIVAAPEAAGASSSSSSSSAAAASISAAAQRVVEACFIRAFDDSTFEPRAAFELDPFESCLSMCVASLGGAESGGQEGEDAAAGSSPAAPATEYVVVGTAYTLSDEEEPSRGRIIVLSVTSDPVVGTRKLSLESFREVKGGVFSVAPLAGGKLVAGINAKIQVYRWGIRSDGGASAAPASQKASRKSSAAAAAAPASSSSSSSASSALVSVGAAAAGSPQLLPECSFTGFVLSLYLDVKGDYILVGDMMKSVTLLRYKPAVGALEEVASEPGSRWMCALAMLDDCTFLGAEMGGNLFSARRNVDAAAKETQARLDVGGEFNLGDMVNRLRPGSLVMLPTELAAPTQQTASAAAAAPLRMNENDEEEEDAQMASSAPKRQRKAPAVASSSSSSSAAAAASASLAAAVAPAPPRPRFIFGTAGGGLGVIITLSSQLYRYLLRVQAAMNGVIHGVGGLSFYSWRAPFEEPGRHGGYGGQSAAKSRGFIDGDFVEQLLELGRADQERVVALMNTAKEAGTELDPVAHPDGSVEGQSTLDELLKVVEDLSRLH